MICPLFLNVCHFKSVIERNHTVCKLWGLLLSLSIIPWRLTWVVHINRSLLFNAEEYSMVCIYHPPAMQETLVQFLGQEDPLEKGQATYSSILGLPCWLTLKNSPEIRETWVWSLGWEDPLEEGLATSASMLAWRIPKDRGAWWATVHGVAKSRKRLSD